jgi:hypothetical protein
MAEQGSIYSDCEFLSREHHEPQEVTMNHIIGHETGAGEASVFILTNGPACHESLS